MSLREKLEALAADEDEDEETRQWALDLLSGKESLINDPKPPARADGGEGRDSPALPRDPGQAFNDMIREARYPHAAHPWWIPERRL